MQQQLPFKCEDHLHDDLKPENFIKEMKTIGKGGFGEVYLCPVEGKIYALKKLPASGNDSKSIDKIKNEIKNLEFIRSIPTKPSSIPVFHGHFLLLSEIFNDLIFCLIFDHFPTTLRELIQQLKLSKTFLPLSKLESYFKNFLFGMAFLQSINISHRDLKPGNLMLDQDGVLKIIDYGLAKDIGELNDTTSKFTFVYEGTPDYMAPEVEDNDKYNPFKADAFSFGLIIMELATTEKIQRKVSLEGLNQSIRDQIALIKKIYENEDQKRVRKFRRILEKCLVVDVKERPDFIEILRETIGNGEEGKEKIKFHIKVEQMTNDECQELFEKESKEKIKFHIKVEQMTKEECQELFESDEKQLFKEEANQLREHSLIINTKLEEIMR